MEKTATTTVTEPASERIGLPRVGDVIVCQAFANAWRCKYEPSRQFWATDAADLTVKDDCEEMHRDQERGVARFVVEETYRSDDYVTWTERRRSGYGGVNEWGDDFTARGLLIVTRRLADDDSYDPAGETVQFVLWGDGPGDTFSRSVREVRRDHSKRCRAILDTPIYKLRTMKRTVRFE